MYTISISKPRECFVKRSQVFGPLSKMKFCLLYVFLLSCYQLSFNVQQTLEQDTTIYEEYSRRDSINPETSDDNNDNNFKNVIQLTYELDRDSRSQSTQNRERWPCTELFKEQASKPCLSASKSSSSILPKNFDNHLEDQRVNLNNNYNGPLCASDGHFYASKCDIELQSCLRNKTLIQQENDTFCKSRFRRLIKLKAQCGPREFEEFKKLLLINSRGVGDLFEQLDSNKNNLIEAHELWPKIQVVEAELAQSEIDSEDLNQIDQNKLFYSWPQYSELLKRRSQSSSSQISYAQLWPGICPRNWAHCWRLLDFAFEPHFKQLKSPNSCSLSHLYLYGTAEPETGGEESANPVVSGLDLHSFGQLFASKNDREQSRRKEEKRIPYEVISVNLGDSLTLDCEPKKNDMIWSKSCSKGESGSGTQNGNANIGNDKSNNERHFACWWSRYQANPFGYSLSSIPSSSYMMTDVVSNDLHIKSSSPASSKLIIRDAQLYISGPFKCHCNSYLFTNKTSMNTEPIPEVTTSSNIHPTLITQQQQHELHSEKLYMLQVIAEPRVEIEPSRQYAMEGSRTNFECVYDFIDTRANCDGLSKPIENDELRSRRKNLASEIRPEVDVSGNDAGEQQELEGDACQFDAKIRWSHLASTTTKRDRNSQVVGQPPPTNRSKLTMQASKLTIEPIQWSDSGQHICQVRVPTAAATTAKIVPSQDKTSSLNGQFIYGRAESRLRVVIGGGPTKEAEPLMFNKPDERLPMPSIGQVENGDKDEGVEDGKKIAEAFPDDGAGDDEDQNWQDGAEEEDDDKQEVEVDDEIEENDADDEDDDKECDFGRKRELGVEQEVDSKQKQEELEQDQWEEETSGQKALNLWMFQDSGISIYRLRQDDGSDGEMELVHQIDGHSLISGQVDGNWNQLTLCGGLTPEQAVICEWSDNAIALNVAFPSSSKNSKRRSSLESNDFKASFKSFASSHDTIGNKLEQQRKRSAKQSHRRRIRTITRRTRRKCKRENENYVTTGSHDDDDKFTTTGDKTTTNHYKQFLYVAQPNLNRIIVIDAQAFEIVAIIQTDPQPRRLHLVKPNRVHLSKWIKRRLSPARQIRLEQRLQQQEAADFLDDRGKSTSQHPRSRRLPRKMRRSMTKVDHRILDQPEPKANQLNDNLPLPKSSSNEANNDNFVQFDIWLLCYGQPLIVDPSMSVSELAFGPPLLPPPSTLSSITGEPFNQIIRGTSFGNSTTSGRSRRSSSSTTASASPSAGLTDWPFALPSRFHLGLTGKTPRALLSTTSDKESRLRNRKSVHIIQSTFFKKPPNQQPKPIINNNNDDDFDGWNHELDPESPNYRTTNQRNDDKMSTKEHEQRSYDPIAEYRRTTLISTHHLSISGSSIASGSERMRNLASSPAGLPFQDLIQDLALPERVRALEFNPKHKQHFAYVSHYNERRLFRVLLDNYHYEREIDLQDCDPIQLTPSALGLLIIQCRAPISHKLTGQLILDELTSTQIEFNEQIKAQDAYLSPDHKYLISIYTSNPSTQTTKQHSHPIPSSPNKSFNTNNNQSNLLQSAQQQSQNETRTIPEIINSELNNNSVIYVQTLTTSGAKFQYEIKTSTLDIAECSFVWRDGYYVAIFVSTDKRDQESEILSLRLADGRLELMARVPGILGPHHGHRAQLIVAPRVHLAALSTNQGTFIVDLQENRISQSIQQHQSPPTLLWV